MDLTCAQTHYPLYWKVSSCNIVMWIKVEGGDHWRYDTSFSFSARKFRFWVTTLISVRCILLGNRCNIVHKLNSQLFKQNQALACKKYAYICKYIYWTMRLFLLKKGWPTLMGRWKLVNLPPPPLLRAQKLKTYPFSAPCLPPTPPPLPLLFYQPLNILKCKRSSVNIHDIFVKIFTCLRFPEAGENSK